MKTYLEDQYRLIGRRPDGSITIAWYDTFEEVLEQSKQFAETVIFRPDGSYVGQCFSRQGVDHV